jgi:eukaryotic-like serine/threonine-protein kinase
LVGSPRRFRKDFVNPDTLTLFREVANRSSAERADYYDRNEVSPVLRTEVESLLQAGDRTVDSFAGHLASAALRALLEDPAAQADPPQAPPARVPLQPAAIGRYRVVRLLGRGGMSDVYLARDPMLERDIAVKLIAGGLDDDVARRRLVREASAAGRLRHPNIVTIFDAGEYDGRPFIAMEYVAGDTVRTLIQRRKPMPLRRRLELIEDACAGLAHAHRAGVVHLDIKPDNLIVDETGVLKVLDFGIARVLSSEAFATRHVLGTLRYMSPEQIAGDPLDHRSDIFSLGCALYELLAYLPAYAGSTREIVYRIAVGPVPRLAEIMPDIDPRLDAAVGRAMALDPADRFADLDEFQAELARIRAELDPGDERAMTIPEARPVDHTHTIAMPIAAGPSPSAALRKTSPHAGSPSTEGVFRSNQLLAGGLVTAALLAIAGGVWQWRSGIVSDTPVAVSRPATPEPAAQPSATPLSAPSAAPPAERVAAPARNETGPPRAEEIPVGVVAGRPSSLSGAAGGEATLSATSPPAAAPSAQVTPAPPPVPVAPVSPPPSAAAALPQPAAQPQPSTRIVPPPAAAGDGAVEAARPPAESDRVLDALNAYRDAFQNKDVGQLRQIYPSLNEGEVKRLRDSMEDIRTYEVSILNPTVDIRGDAATVRAVLARRITPDVGAPFSSENAFEFRLQRNGGKWLITAANPR